MTCDPSRKLRTSVFLSLSSVWLLLFCLPRFISAAHAQVINYPSGFAASSGQIFLANGAVLSGPAIQLTNNSDHTGRNAWYETPVNVQAFTTTFTFTMNCGGNVSTCGSGMGFLIISKSNPSGAGYNFTGFSGNQFSWSQCQGTGLTNCVAIDSVMVKFDMFNVTTSSPGANLTGFYSGGTYPEPPNNPQYDMAPSGIDMQSGDLMRCTLSYNGATLTETVTDTVTNAVYTKSYTANIPSLVGGSTAYVGFGGGTADVATVVQDLTSWIYTVESPGQAATPTFSPTAGTYSGSQSVTLSTATAGAVICYNTTGSPATNGSTSCATGTLYTGAVVVPSSETLYAVSGGTGFTDSPVVSANYVIQTSVAAPTYSPAGGIYTSAQSVTISDATSNATIYYTTDGTAPTTSSTRFAGPITVSSTETLKAIAVAAGETNSPAASAVYTITALPTVATPTFSPASGVYNSAQSVTISDATSGATIYYATNGTAPTASSTKYTGPITINSTETLQAIAVATGENNSAVASASYTISALPLATTPAFSPAPGTYSSTQSVTISDATPDATIYYTTNGTAPTPSSNEYMGPITVSSTEMLQAIAAAPGDADSTAASAAYTITSSASTAATPAFLPGAGAYTSAQLVAISDATSGATIYYTTNGTTPTTASTVYTAPITVGSTETLEAVAVATGSMNSVVASAAYTITPLLPTLSTPTFSPAPGTYNAAQSVAISDATSGATIYYTTDGTTPTTSSTHYAGPIMVTATETLQAIAGAPGTANSAVASAAYTISSLPNFTLVASPASITVNSGGQGTVMLSVTPQNGFDSSVTLACTGLPAGATCAFAPATVTPSSAAATTQVTISTGAQSSARQPRSQPLFPFTTLAVTVGLFGWRRRRAWHRWLLVTVAYAGLGLLFGCNGTSGGSGATPTPNPSPSPTATTSMVTVTATSGALQQAATISLTVN